MVPNWKNRKGIEGRGGQMATLLLEHFKGQRHIRGAEIGVLTGKLSAFMLREVPNLHLYMIDMWTVAKGRYLESEEWAQCLTQEGKGEEHMELAISNTSAYRHRRTIIQLPSLKAVKCFAKGKLDFVFIDADHTEEGAFEDLTAWVPKVREGGLICGHDYGNRKEESWGVERAVKQYFGSTDGVHVGADFVWWKEI